MKLPNTRIEKAMCRDGGTTLDKIRYNAETERVEAGDGSICAMVPISEDNPCGTFFLTADAVDYIRSHGPDFFIDDGYALVAGATFEPPKNQKFPKDLTLVVPDNDEMYLVATIDVDLLYRLAQAVCPIKKDDLDGTSYQELYVALFAKKEDSHKSPLAISCVENEHNIGVLMPLHNKNRNPSYIKPTKS